MKNINMSIKGKMLTIEIDLDQDFGPSKSGKTIVIATTSGNKEIKERPGVHIGVNVYKGR